ncbi:unnamed protein product [Cylindrotheca closterium]|uniref:Uncharacterized protein n=1 Tax=Cylindrotheca closterium TaxID=2856 RepID=A0AAD2JJJ0_9STRA|nr:unnamed protein product [Cylindrotheca closterium]
MANIPVKKKSPKADAIRSSESSTGVRRSRRRKHIMYIQQRDEQEDQAKSSPTKVQSTNKPSTGNRSRSTTTTKIQSTPNDPERQKREEIRHMSRWIEMIIKEGWPLSSVDDEAYRDKIGLSSDITLQQNQVAEVILAMNQLVMKKIGSEMKAARRGAILHSEGIESSRYIVGIVASYMVGPKVTQTLLALGEVHELRSVVKRCSTRQDTTMTADSIAEKHARYIQQQVFSDRYDFNSRELQKWLVCQTAITCNAITKVASLLGIPHVDCQSQLLDKQVKQMLERTKGTTFGVGQLISEVREVIKTAQESKYSSDELRNFLRILDDKEEGWSSGATMIAKFHAKKSDILKAVQHEDEKIIVRCNSLINSDRATKQAQKMLQNLKFIQRRLTTKGHPLSSCREDIQSLLDYADAHSHDIESQWFDHKLGTKYIHPLSKKLKDVNFISGVCKIQRKKFALLNDVETTACQQLKRPTMAASPVGRADDFKAFVCRKERQASLPSRDNISLRSIYHLEEEYSDCDFIIGSSSEMEKVWSDARQHKAAQDDTISVALFEAIMMLRYNWRLWDASTVGDAVEYVKSNTSDEQGQKSKKRRYAT